MQETFKIKPLAHLFEEEFEMDPFKEEGKGDEGTIDPEEIPEFDSETEESM